MFLASHWSKIKKKKIKHIHKFLRALIANSQKENFNFDIEKSVAITLQNWKIPLPSNIQKK